MNRDITIGNYTFDEAKHVHTLDGKALTGVTTILAVMAKPALIPWAAGEVVKYIQEHANKIFFQDDFLHYEVTEEQLAEAKVAHRKKKETAGDWGTEVHAEVEKYIYNVMENKMAVYDSRIDPFIKWAVDNKVKFLASEKHVHSRRLWIGGIADIICEIDGKRYVGDIKTSSGIYPEAFIQGSAYASCLVESGELPFDGIVILNLKKDGKFDYQYNYDIQGNLECFEACLKIYRHMQAITKK